MFVVGDLDNIRALRPDPPVTILGVADPGDHTVLLKIVLKLPTFKLSPQLMTRRREEGNQA